MVCVIPTDAFDEGGTQPNPFLAGASRCIESAARFFWLAFLESNFKVALWMGLLWMLVYKLHWER